MDIELISGPNLETHITIATASEKHVELARNYAINGQLKWTYIELDNGRFQSQPMITFWKPGSLDDQLSRAKEIRNDLLSIGVETVRVKVECEASNLSNIFKDNDSVKHHSGYFECHLKIKLNHVAEVESLRKFVLDYDARLSSNARRHLSGRTSEWFVTQRAHNSSAEKAKNQNNKLVSALKGKNFVITESESEYVLFDSNLKLDKGWL